MTTPEKSAIIMETKKLEITYRGQPLHIGYFIRPGQEETILYLHGLGCSKEDFLGATTADELAVYTLAAFDFPGCGNSSYHENMALGIDDLVEITNIFVSRLTLGDLVVAGHSMGGLVALLYIEKYGRSVKGFMSVEGNVASEDCFISRGVTKYTLVEFKGAGFRNLRQRLSRLKNRGYQKYADTLERYSSPQAIFDYSPSLVDYSDNGNLIQRYTQLEIPTVFIYGSENRGLSYIPHLREKGCEVVEVSKSDHFPFYDNPRDYYGAISDFLEKI